MSPERERTLAEAAEVGREMARQTFEVFDRQREAMEANILAIRNYGVAVRILNTQGGATTERRAQEGLARGTAIAAGSLEASSVACVFSLSSSDSCCFEEDVSALKLFAVVSLSASFYVSAHTHISQGALTPPTATTCPKRI